MGAWSSDPFGNDSACDWVYTLEETDDLSFIQSTLESVLLAGDDYLDSCEAEEAVAAADTLARLKGRFSIQNSYTESVDAWVAAHPITPPASLINTALEALERIHTDPSELLELWKDSDEFSVWMEHLNELKERLKD